MRHLLPVIAPGTTLPDLALTDTGGRSVSLASLRGEPTLLVFLRHLG